MSLSETLSASLVLVLKFSGNAAPHPSLAVVQSKTWRYLPLMRSTHSSAKSADPAEPGSSALAVDQRLRTRPAVPTATLPRKPRRGVIEAGFNVESSGSGA